MSRIKILLSLMLILVVGLVAACDEDGSSDAGPTAVGAGVAIPDNAIQIDIIYAPESDLYMPETIREFNQAFAS